MSLTFPLADEPDFEPKEKGRLLFAGPVDFLKGVVAMVHMPPADRLEVCFAGRSNVGKSSLINALTGGCLGSHNDEERSEMRYFMRIALLRESSKL